uniref:Uncharacterized protein AlNc14C65G4636 n=1 Tax=Albugo laibachii Nc14 TaxID=890382 RepID=F0WDB6_9STRA|nr:conserved hypothetical protein [Albugo laibachii Nc14]|eukprot:CCA19188.1 conserved hypothetical protein [Albugo laibachii Nc14]
MRWHSLHPSLPTKAVLRIRSSPSSDAGVCGRISKGKALMVLLSDADRSNWFHVKFPSEHNAMEFVEGHVMACLPDGTELLVPWEQEGFLKCVRVYDPNVLVYGDASCSDNALGSIGDENGSQFPFGVLTIEGSGFRIFHDVYESCWVDSRDCEITCERLHHNNCQTPHAFYSLNPELPNEAQVAVRDYPAKEAECVGRLEHGQIIEAHFKSGDWLQMSMSKAQTYWIMLRSGTVQLLVEVQDHGSPQCELIDTESKRESTDVTDIVDVPLSEPTEKESAKLISENEIAENAATDLPINVMPLKCAPQDSELGKEEPKMVNDAVNDDDLRETDSKVLQTHSNGGDNSRYDTAEERICCPLKEEKILVIQSDEGETDHRCIMDEVESVSSHQATLSEKEGREIDEEYEELTEQIHEMEVSINEIEIESSQSDDDINMDGDEPIETCNGNEHIDADENSAKHETLKVPNDQNAPIWDWDERPLTGKKSTYEDELPVGAYGTEGAEGKQPDSWNVESPNPAVGSAEKLRVESRMSECCTEEASASPASPSSSLLLPAPFGDKQNLEDVSASFESPGSSSYQVSVETTNESIAADQQNVLADKDPNKQIPSRACQHKQPSPENEGVLDVVYAEDTIERGSESITPGTEPEHQLRRDKACSVFTLTTCDVNCETTKEAAHSLEILVSTSVEPDQLYRPVTSYSSSKVEEVEVNGALCIALQEQKFEQACGFNNEHDNGGIHGESKLKVSTKVEGGTLASAEYLEELNESGDMTEDEAWMQNITDDDVPLLEEDLFSTETIKSAAFHSDLEVTQEGVDVAIGDISLEVVESPSETMDEEYSTMQLRGLDILRMHGVERFCCERLISYNKNNNQEACKALQVVMNSTGDDLLEQIDTIEADSYYSTEVTAFFFPPNVEHVVPYSADALLDVLYSRVSKVPFTTAQNSRSPKFWHSHGRTRESAFQELMAVKKDLWSHQQESETAEFTSNVFNMIMDDADPIDILMAEYGGPDLLTDDNFSLLRSFEYRKPMPAKKRVDERLEKERAGACRQSSFSSPDMKSLLRAKTLKRSAAAISKTPPLTKSSNKSKIDPLADPAITRCDNLSLNQRLWADPPVKSASTSQNLRNPQVECPSAASGINPHHGYPGSVSSATSLMSERCRNILKKRANTTEHLHTGSDTLRRSFLQKPSVSSSLRSVRSESQGDGGLTRLSLPSRSKLEFSRSSAVANGTRLTMSKRWLKDTTT